jgi:fatty acid CoA ligase FadD9
VSTAAGHRAAIDGTTTQPGSSERLDGPASRAAHLYATDSHFAAAEPKLAIGEATRQPGMRLAPALRTLVAGYADRPALGRRAAELVRDPATGRTSRRLLPRFDTISYLGMWVRVNAVASAWRQDVRSPVTTGDFVAIIGFASPEYLMIDLVCIHLGLVSVPLQHNAPVSRLRPIIDEVTPRVVAVSAEYLDLAVDAALGSESLRRLMVFDYHPEVDDQREKFDAARRRLRDAGVPVILETFDEVVARGRVLTPEPEYTGGTDARLAMILYTSGSTGAPKGAMYTERILHILWTTQMLQPTNPVFNVNFMPLNHLAGRTPLTSAFLAGGTSYFVAKSDLSTLFDDWALVRPTHLPLVPRVVDMLYQSHRTAIDARVVAGEHPVSAEAAATQELRVDLLGGRVLGGLISTAPLAREMRTFLESTVGAHIADGYGLTEVGMVTRDEMVARPLVLDYKLVDVPELGYFGTDRPHPRGEVLVKTEMTIPGYFKRPEITAEVFDADGYYRTGDVMAEVTPDRLVYVDRRSNVIKLAQGEFVAVARLEAIFAAAPLIHQVFVYGNSERAALLAVIVPTTDAVAKFDDADALKSAVRESLRSSATRAELHGYEVPIDVLIEYEPFSTDNGLLAGVGKALRPRLKEHYGERLEQMYADLAVARDDEIRVLRATAATIPVLDTLSRAATALLGPAASPHPDAHFTDLGGDSLSALTFSNLLQDIFSVDVPVGVIIGPAANLRTLADHVETARRPGTSRPTFATVHRHRGMTVSARDLTLEKFIDARTLAAAPTLAHATGGPRTVLLTGANGWLGRFLALEWLERLSQTDGRLVAVVRGRDAAEARARLDDAFDSGDPDLLRRYRKWADDRLEVVVGDIDQPDMGLDPDTWTRLATSVDLIVHSAALVNHVLPYAQLIGPNVVGTAEVIRLAITDRIKPVTYLSTVAVATAVAPGEFTEGGDIRTVSPLRSVDTGYANGYANSKWAGEVLLREAHDLCGLPVAVFRSDMILAHTRYAGQLNMPDLFTRLILSVIATGLAPASFYQTDPDGGRQRAHYDGLPVDFVAEAITTLGAQVTTGFSSFDVMNPHDDGVSLDTFVDWLVDTGHAISRIGDYTEWLTRFETALVALPERQRAQSVLPLLHAFRQPATPLHGASAPTEMFHAAVRRAKVGAGKDIPHLTADLLEKYASDLEHLGLLTLQKNSTTTPLENS